MKFVISLFLVELETWEIKMLQSFVILLALCSTALGLTKEEINQFEADPHTEKNTGLQGTVSVKADPNKPGTLILKSNGIPDHDTGTFPNPSNPNSITEQNNVWRVNKNPTKASQTTCLPMGPIAMAINGVAMYNPFTIGCCDAGTEELELFDNCTGHPSPNGAYHYHIYPSCVADIICDDPSGIIGVAFDGFPIYGPIDENGIQLTKADLDECNGREGADGSYRYHIIKEYPYFMGCYSGKVRNDVGVNMGTCQCTEPVEVCEEFGGGGGPPPPRPQQMQRIKRETANEFTCCTDEKSCSDARIFVPDKSDGDGNGATTAVTSGITVLFSSIAAMILN